MSVPLGTVARRSSGELIGEVLHSGARLLLLRGGRGGRGNVHFASATRQTPTYAEKGRSGEEDQLTLELSLLADVGLVGAPNAGKSTLLATLSAAQPEIAPYPFTTLQPNLGIVPFSDYRSFVMADLPGIIEKASEGKGLGFRFLRHIERNSVLAFVISAEEEDISLAFRRLKGELLAYKAELNEKEQLIVITKSDLLDEAASTRLRSTCPKEVAHYMVSSHRCQGIEELKNMLWKVVQQQNKDV